MEIIVTGKANEYFKPDQIILNINFYVKENAYEDVLIKGTNNVKIFIDEVLINNGFKNDDLKTRSFIIKEEKKYDNISNNYIFDGFSYNQEASLKFNYDKELLSKLMVDISKLESAPKYKINFGLINEKDIRKNVLTLSYNDALEKATILANASHKNILKCIKIDYKNDVKYFSQSNLDSELMYARETANTINEIFTPEDILVSEEIICHFIAE